MTGTGPLDGASGLRSTALALRFALELALLAGAAALAWRLAPGWWGWPAAILAVALVATLWGLFLGTGLGLTLIGFGVAAIIGVALWALDRIALAILRR